MKRASVLATLAAFFKPDADQVALDSAVDAAMCAAETKAAADARTEMDAADQKANPGSWEDDPAKPGAKKRKMIAKDVAPVVAVDTVTKADAEKLATDAATAAVAKALADERALVKARTDVSECVGAVALDSAEAVYRFALKDAKVDGVDAIHASALPALWAQVKAGKTRSTLAQDGKQDALTTDARAAVAAIGL